MKKLIIASNNKGKIAEIAKILEGRFEVVSMRDAGLNIDIAETGMTFEENAIIKARECYRLTGFAALADDSGLEVMALGGAPGVYSARYGGGDEDNIDLLLKNMEGVENRRARFVCVMALCEGGKIVLGRGETAGDILRERVGTGGFGYDSVFLSRELGISFGFATADAKNSVSHRRRALDDLLENIKN